MLLLIGEYYGDPRQSFGHSHGAKYFKNITYGGYGGIYLLSLLVGQKVVVT